MMKLKIQIGKHLIKPTDENNNIPVNVDHEEVFEPQNTDSNNGSKRKPKDERNTKEKTNEWRELYRCQEK